MKFNLLMVANDFAYDQWRTSERLRVQVALSYPLKAMISDLPRPTLAICGVSNWPLYI